MFNVYTSKNDKARTRKKASTGLSQNIQSRANQLSTGTKYGFSLRPPRYMSP